MGIIKTFKYLEKLTKFYPHVSNLARLKNKSVAIDAAVYMWKFKTSTNQRGIYQFIDMLNIFAKYRIRPIFISDGDPINIKMELIAKRKEAKLLLRDEKRVTWEDWDFLEMLLDLYQVARLRINGREAEGYCSYLNRIGKVDYVMTEDTDVLIYGANQWIRHIDLTSKKIVIYDLALFREKVNNIGITRLLDFAIIHGTDFNSASAEHGEEIDYEKELITIKNLSAIKDEFTSDEYLQLLPVIKFIKKPKIYKILNLIPDEIAVTIFPQVFSLQRNYNSEDINDKLN